MNWRKARIVSAFRDGTICDLDNHSQLHIAKVFVRFPIAKSYRQDAMFYLLFQALAARSNSSDTSLTYSLTREPQPTDFIEFRGHSFDTSLESVLMKWLQGNQDKILNPCIYDEKEHVLTATVGFDQIAMVTGLVK